MGHVLAKTTVLFLALGLTVPAKASLVLVTDPSMLPGADRVDWGQLGPDGTVAPSTSVVRSLGGLAVTVKTADPNGLLRFDEGTGWIGNFLPGEELLTNNSQTYAPLTVSFASRASGVGANIQRDLHGPFTATISAYSGSRLLGTFTEEGDSNSLGDGSAIFIGVTGTEFVITKVVFGLELSDSPYPGWDFPNWDFAINSLRVVVPEPPTLATVGIGVLAALSMVWLRRRVA